MRSPNTGTQQACRALSDRQDRVIEKKRGRDGLASHVRAVSVDLRQVGKRGQLRGRDVPETAGVGGGAIQYIVADPSSASPAPSGQGFYFLIWARQGLYVANREVMCGANFPCFVCLWAPEGISLAVGLRSRR
jgi:hypothetical protein